MSPPALTAAPGRMRPSGSTSPIPTDRFQGLLEHALGAFGRLVLALAAVHALPPLEITRLLTADLDLARGRLDVRRGPPRHTLHLEELTHRLAVEMAHRAPSSLAALHQPSPAGQPADRDGRQSPERRRRHPERSMPVTGAVSVAIARGPHPRRSPSHGRPSPPDAPVRYQHRSRDALHRCRSSRKVCPATSLSTPFECSARTLSCRTSRR